MSRVQGENGRHRRIRVPSTKVKLAMVWIELEKGWTVPLMTKSAELMVIPAGRLKWLENVGDPITFDGATDIVSPTVPTIGSGYKTKAS